MPTYIAALWPDLDECQKRVPVAAPDAFQRAVLRAVVYEDHFVFDGCEGGGQFVLEVGDVVFFVVERDYDGNH